MTIDREMMKALEADGEKLRQLTGEDHGPFNPYESYPYTAGALEASLRQARETLALVHTDVRTSFSRDKITQRLNSIDELLARIPWSGE